MRILVAGGPRVGKTFLGAELQAANGATLRHTDDLIATHKWSEASEEVARWLDAPGDWIIEGVAIPRALRKWLAANPTGLPAEQLYWRSLAREPLTTGQYAMAKGCETVWCEIEHELRRRGLAVIPF